VLLGGTGDDLLVGGSGRDLLIGGAGADRLVGDPDDDILIAGSTAFDGLEAALCAIMDEWTSTRTYDQRTSNLVGTTTTGANGQYYLKTGTTNPTVFDDDAKDVMTGSSGQDGFFANLDSGVLDKITDLSASEFAEDLDIILGP
jgi:Ca2+-binding RTX toxin-like protein